MWVGWICVVLAFPKGLDVVDILIQQRDVLIGSQKALAEVDETMEKGVSALRMGMCNFIGLCFANPAPNCDAVINQPGLNGAILPSGKYWLSADYRNVPVGQTVRPERVECKFNGTEGWALLFDDSDTRLITQKPNSTVMKYFRFSEFLAFTPAAAKGHGRPIRQAVHPIVPSTATDSAGRLYEEIHNVPWTGQDLTGRDSSAGAYPNHQQHYRYKYFGAVDPANPFSGTVFVLDDGAVGDSDCLDLVDRDLCGQEVFCAADQTIVGSVPQTMISTTPGGIVSLGCALTNDKFTRCGGCSYNDALDNTVIRKMYVR